ncbi:MAG: HAD-IA family hydrolase [Verrucomicrobia bacterium]|nr:HAD-IA family hydrolase [Verrucomicrobiota bacterium]
MKWRTPIRAVSFDVGGTLIAAWPSVGHVYAAVARRFTGELLKPRALDKRFAAVWRARAGAFDHSRAAWAELVAEVFARSPLAANEEFFNALYEHFASPSAWRIYDDVLPTLRSLRQRGFRLAVISNWDDRLRPLLERLELSRFFEVIVVSGELGAHKPAAEIFAHAAGRLGLAPGAILHVGDSENEDVRGARAAGFQAVQVRREAPPSPPGRIASLCELEGLSA